MEELRLYQDLAIHSWLASPEQQALLEGVEISGPLYVASSSETSARGLNAAVACVRPAGCVKPISGSQGLRAICVDEHIIRTQRPPTLEAIAAVPVVAASIQPSTIDAAGASFVTGCVEGECGARASSGKHSPRSDRLDYTVCVLVTFQWAGMPQALHVLHEQGSEPRSGAIVARHLAILQVAASLSECERHKRDRWVSFARKRQSKSGSASAWMATSAEVRLLLAHGAINSAYGSRPGMRLLEVQVALEELERLCVGQHEDVFSLREALDTAQPASTAANQPRLAAALTGSTTMPGICRQRTDQATPDSPAALAHPSPHSLQPPASQQMLSIGEMPPPGAAATGTATQEEPADAPLTASAALAGARGRRVGPHVDGLSQHAAVTQPSCKGAAEAAHLQCHEALASIGHATEELRSGKGKRRPPRAPDHLVRQAGEDKGLRCARKQHRSQAGHGAASTADSSADAGAIGAGMPAVRGGRFLGRGKSRPQIRKAVRPPKQQAAAEGRQLSQSPAHRVSSGEVDAKETTSAEAARIRLHAWTQKQGLASTVSRPAVPAQTTGQGEAPAKGSATADEGAARSTRLIRQPYAEALLAIPQQLASPTKRRMKSVAAPEQTGRSPKKRTRTDTFHPIEKGAETEGRQSGEQLAPTVVEGSMHAQSGGQHTPTLAEDSKEDYSTSLADRILSIIKQQQTIRRQNVEIARLKEAWQRDMARERKAYIELQRQLSQMVCKYVVLLCRLSDVEA